MKKLHENKDMLLALLVWTLRCLLTRQLCQYVGSDAAKLCIKTFLASREVS